MEWLRQNFAHLAALAPIAFGAVTLIGLAAAWRLGRGNRFLIPSTARGRVASIEHLTRRLGCRQTRPVLRTGCTACRNIRAAAARCLGASSGLHFPTNRQ